MSTAVVGGIEIQMLADLARLKRDMDECKRLVGGAAQNMQSAFNSAKTALAAIGTGLSVVAFTNWIKGAIDAADETYNLSQKVGVAVRDLGGLKLAFGQAGIEGNAMQTSLVKLSQKVSENAQVFGRLGVSVKASDGTLKSSMQVLYEVADVFKAMPDGINKTTSATEIFGKAGADLIPMLNDGSKGLEEMADMAEKLGLVIDDTTAKAADEFNDTLDLLGKGVDGVAMGVASSLLPTLNSLGGSMLTTMASSDFLKWAMVALGSVFQALYNLAQIVVGVIKVVGQAFLGLAKGAVLIAQGEFHQAAVAFSAAWNDMGDTAISTGNAILDVWDGTAAGSVAAGATMMRAQTALGVSAKDYEDQQKAAGEEAKKRAADQKKYSEDMIKQGAEMEKARQEWLDAEAVRNLQRIRQYEDQQAAVDKSVESAVAMVAAIERETEMLGMSNVEREISTALLQLEKEGIEKGTFAYDVYAEKIRAAILDRDAVRTSIEQTKAIGDEWKKTTDAIGDSLTDALFRAFESGKDFGQALKEGLVNTFKTTILQPVIRAVMAPVTGAMGSMFSGGASAAGGGGSAGGLGGLGNIGSLLGGLGSLGTIAGTGFGMTMAGGLAGTGAALGSAGAMLSGGATASGMAMGIGALGPYALAAMAIYALAKKLDKGGTPHIGSVVGADAAGQFSMLGDGSTIMNNFNADTDAALRSISGVSVGSLNALSNQFGGSGGFSSVARFAADGTDASIGQYILQQNGQRVGYVGNGSDYAKYSSNAADAYAAFADDIAAATASAVKSINLPKWARDQFKALGTDATLQEFGTVADSVMRTQGALRDLTAAVNPLGGIFTKVAGLSSDALFQLTSFAGGIEAFGQKAGAFAQTYYSADEQAGIQARTLRESLKAAGFTDSMIRNLDTKGEFRDLVESRNLGTSVGRMQLAALLDMAPAFAQFADYVAENGGNLASTAANAPTGALLESVLSSTLQQSQAATSANTTAEANNALLQRIVDTLNGGNTTLLAALVESTQVQRLIAEGSADTVRVMERVDDKLEDISANGSLAGSAPNYTGNVGDGPTGGA